MNILKSISGLLLVGSLLLSAAEAGAEYKDGYYNGMNGKKKEALKKAAKQAVTKHTRLEYYSLPEYWEYSDVYPDLVDGQKRWWDMYSDAVYLIRNGQSGRQSFSANNVALMCAIATPSATACYAAAEDKDIPVVFTAITDPVEAKLDSGNITGTSDKLPVEAQLDLIRALQPEAKTIGIVYTVSEPNSVSAIAEYEAKCGDYGFEVKPIGVTAQSEVTQAIDTLLGEQVDCFSNLTDNNVVGVLSSILEKTDEAGVPVYGSEVEQVKMGCVASAGIDYIALGRQTGEMAAKILKGEATASEMDYETITEYGIYINSDALAAMGITVPQEIADRAIESTAE